MPLCVPDLGVAGVLVVTDSIADAFFPAGGVLSPTGWNIVDIRFAYDAVSDTAYFGELSVCCVRPGT